MFFALFGATVIVALATSLAAARFFDVAVNKILQKTLGPDLTEAWRKYIYFAIFVAGLSGGVRQWELEKYLPPAPGKGSGAMELTGARWLLEIFNTLTEALRSIALIMLMFFLCAMMAYVIAQALARRQQQSHASDVNDHTV
ncbi:MAG TPA: hypothetical protein VJ642_00125 [Chromobacteriaceae bacterium]|nr:hypothetical protein [Chromobacteriaceae bacterium]